MPQPDFSPSMLRGFLFARSIARIENAPTRRAGNARDARNDLARELMAETGLAWSDVRAAFSGRLSDPTKLARLWSALGHEVTPAMEESA